MAEREEQADGDRPLALLHEFARGIVDGGDMVGVDRVAQAEGIGEQAEPSRTGWSREGREGPDPGQDYWRE